ncbi:thyroid transcription factor 1-associated protein 26 homolog isoform X2 [Scleropages formosus]|uniref:thyroid transcription factor 1-associated protein 26 homolog isoform X2 n=1 Tax=Scleropages formosus TaxID=113540 RepID=UPI000878F09C|nr:thyroid transcription factor 1-associated protein 26 isoform X2 [Scleropages formosus]
MAPTDRKMKNKGDMNAKGVKKNLLKGNRSTSGKTKRKWVPQQKVFVGSIQEGQGFALNRRQKVHYEYKKLLRKGDLRAQSKVRFEEEYPEHLKHLYAAEAEKLSREEESKRRNRSKRLAAASEEGHPEAESPQAPSVPEEIAAPSLVPVSAPSGKKMRGKTSYQKTKEEYERIREKRAKKKEAYLRSKEQREEALRIYKQKKLQMYQILSKKTKKGQPNLNAQMEFLLQKIQDGKK